MRDEVLIIGCGKIGSSLIDGWLNKKKEFSQKFSRINVLEKSLKNISGIKILDTGPKTISKQLKNLA